MKKSLLTISLVLVFLMMFAGSVFAQDPMPHVFCGELSDEDCAILVESQEAMMALTSGTSESEMNVFIAGIPDAPVDELAFSLASSSAFSIDAGITEMLAELQGMPPAEMMADPEALLEMMAALYGGVDNEGEITISLSDGFVELLTADNDLDIPDTFSIGISVVDGIIYANLSDLADVTPEAAMLDAWYGVDIVELLGSLAPGADNLDPNQLNAMSSGLFFSTGMKSDAAFDEFVAIERLEDDEIDGQEVAVFLSTFDFASFLASPIFRDMVVMQMQQSGTPMDSEELDQTLSMVGLFAPMLLTDLDAGSVQVIGLEDGYLHQTQTYFTWDLSALAALAPDQLETAPLIEFEAFSENANFGADIEIAVPDGAFVIPTEMVLSALAQ